MGFTYNQSENILSVEFMGFNYSRLNFLMQLWLGTDDLCWNNTVIVLCSRQYAVEVAHVKSWRYALAIRPVQPYSEREFENLFGFCSQCTDFTKNRVVGVCKKQKGGTARILNNENGV